MVASSVDKARELGARRPTAVAYWVAAVLMQLSMATVARLHGVGQDPVRVQLKRCGVKEKQLARRVLKELEQMYPEEPWWKK